MKALLVQQGLGNTIKPKEEFTKILAAEKQSEMKD